MDFDCKICGRKCKSASSVVTHVHHSHGLLREEYYRKYLMIDKDESKCKNCGNRTKLINITQGYQKICSNICAKNYKVKCEYCGKMIHFSGLKIHQGSKRCKAPFINEYVQDISKRMIENNPMKLEEQRERMRNNNPMRTKETKTNQTERIRKGNPVNDKKIRDKIRNTLLANHPMRGKTYEELYGKEKAKQLKKQRGLFLKGKTFVEVFGEERARDIGKRISKNKPITGKTFEEYYGKSKAKKLKEEARQRLLNGQAAYMNSFIKNPSKPQVELYELTKSIYPDTKLNHPCMNFSLDVAIPSLKIAIEYDGSYWHQDKKVDEERQNLIETKGWKFIRYTDYVPTIQELKNDINNLI